MDNQVVYLFLFFIFAITMAGGWIPTLKPWSQKTFRMLISFCAGILLGAVFFHMVPEISPILGREMGFPVMLGFLGIYVMEKFIMVHPCEEGACDYHKIGLAAYVGIGFHSILDGVAIGAGNILNISLVILLAVTLHKFPAALALSSILVKGGEYSKQKILKSMFIFALATPLGALISLNVMGQMDSSYPIGFALGVSAGTFLYISIGDLLPTVHEEDEKKHLNLMLLFMGLLVMFLSTGLEG
ncbi:MAG: ZIP family metal transporter [Nitrospinaceae bacterium]|nr:ZIP family metal transporter [Nitrospinaceae bacterium]NIR57735.1 ZIP family metal transporter [Nitrospinaceae bacterium]NIS88195.1 ZIP family metal transporter [Nitrospinaceae bacterium]NIT85079.1 ZIP family metal transporter [Nitrospinaceae bacterium]NIU47233.1 ZIP family metal transporter [Nitrospinaceae bacterium]